MRLNNESLPVRDTALIGPDGRRHLARVADITRIVLALLGAILLIKVQFEPLRTDGATQKEVAGYVAAPGELAARSN